MKITAALRHTLNTALNLLYPPRCFACREILPIGGEAAAATGLCQICAALPLKPITAADLPCTFCGRPAGGRGVCPDCNAKQNTITSGYALFLYEETARDIIINFKYHLGPSPAMRAFLTDIIKEHLDIAKFAGADYIVPVPLHKRKLKRRGFNQSEVIAGIVSVLTGVPLLTDALFRVRYTKAQASVSALAREKNVQGAFATAQKNPNKNQILSKVLLLVDDIYTTGSTMRACAETLLQAGAETINGFSFCITSGKTSL